MTSLIKKLIPRSVKEGVRHLERERIMKKAIGQALSLADGEAPSSELLSSLGRGWGDDGFRAVGGYLEEVARRAVETKGPVLEIGSGLTTLILGLLAGRRGVTVWTLEHLQEFHHNTRKKLDHYDIQNVHLTLAPLRDYVDFSWYTPPLDTMPSDFRLVIADGPPEDTKGGRFGLLPIMRSHIASDAVILLDDAERESEQAVLRQWNAQYGLNYTLNERDGKAWGVASFS